MNFTYALIALLCWSGSDLFSKLVTKQNDKLSHWRVIFAVGAIMGLHAVITLICSNFLDPETTNPFILSILYTDFVPSDFIKYLPVAFVYLLAMVIGYAGLRYIELSISSPICNASGSFALIILVILSAFGVLCEPVTLNFSDIIAVVFLTIGIVGLGYVEYNESDEIKLMRSEKSQFKYRKSFIAILIPIIYLGLDGLATVGDELLWDREIFVSDYAANTAFEFTSLCFAIFAFCYVKFIKKKKFFMLNVVETDENGNEIEKAVPFSKHLIYGGIFETFGQIFYMAVVAAEAEQFLPMISAYCVVSLIWARIFVKEKLSLKHYITIFITVAGILLLCLSELLVGLGIL
ncbi:MAG: hypothetical protein J6R88_04730 [Clostridia bacterium]|nr:hypothetical protein [Clostridia bacterium]